MDCKMHPPIEIKIKNKKIKISKYKNIAPEVLDVKIRT